MKRYVYQKTEAWRDKSSSSEWTLRGQCNIQTHGSSEKAPAPATSLLSTSPSAPDPHLPPSPHSPMTPRCLVLELPSAGEGARRKGTGSSIPICTPVSPLHIQTCSILAATETEHLHIRICYCEARKLTDAITTQTDHVCQGWVYHVCIWEENAPSCTQLPLSQHSEGLHKAHGIIMEKHWKQTYQRWDIMHHNSM